MTKTLTIADLFCGAGGTLEGATQACEELGIKVRAVAVNHWDVAVQTHSANHPSADHYCASLELVNPRELVEIGKLDLLIASPECSHHSQARGGRPVNDQSRATAWCVTRWAEAVLPKAILVENVPAFLTWGPLKQKRIKGRLEWVPDPKRKGQTFLSWVATLESLGYKVEWKTLNAADYGDPTSRVRLFIQARRDRKPIVWPQPTHAPKEQLKKTRPLFAHSAKSLQPHRPARDIIDWSLKGESIFGRKRPLSPNTMARIVRGLEKFCGLPFIVPQLSGGANRTVDQPVPTITTTSRGIGLCQPFIVVLRNHADAQSLEEPLKTLTTGGNFGIAEPFIVRLRGGQDAQSIDDPLSAITTKGAHHALCQPFIMVNRNNNAPKSVDEPLPPLCTGNHMYLIEPFLTGYNGNHNSRGNGDQRSARIDPFIIPLNHGKADMRHYSIDRPFPTITSFDAWALIRPCIVKYYGTAYAQSVDAPLGTVTSKDRFGLVEPVLEEGEGIALLDVRFRMLQPHELAAAMSFPKGYVFMGTREQKVKQIGNAVAVNMAKALCKAIITERSE